MWNRNGLSGSAAALPTTTNPAPGARPTPTFSTIEAAHTGLIERLAVLKPNRILYIADAHDLEERAEHLQQVLGAVLDYVGAIVADTSHVAPGGSIDRKYLLGLISIWLAMLPARSPMWRMTPQPGGRGEHSRARGDERQLERRAVMNRQSPIPAIRSRRGFLAALSAGAASEQLSTNLIVQLGLAIEDLAPFAVRGLFAPRRPWPAEPHTGTSAIFVDKLNPGRLKRFLQHCTGFLGYVRPECTFDALYGWERETGSQREVGLRPS